MPDNARKVPEWEIEVDRILEEAEKRFRGKIPRNLPQIVREIGIVKLWEHRIATGQAGKVIVVNPRSIWYFRESLDAITSILAHEATHIYLGHSLKGDRNEEERQQDEIDADQLACTWGFKSEILSYHQIHEQVRQRRDWLPLSRLPPSCDG